MLAQCSRTASNIASNATPAPIAVKICTEKAAARMRADSRGETGSLVWSINRQCYQESDRFACPRLRRSAAQIR
jgi:hypothetical protein